MANCEPLALVTRWFGFISGILTIILWGFLLPSKSPSLEIPHNFIDDTNFSSWRMSLFSFVPSVFIDFWTPLLFGLLSVLAHLQSFSLSFINDKFVNFFLWNFVLAIFANLGYCGGIGIVVGAFSLLTALLSLICIFVCKQSTANLNLNL